MLAEAATLPVTDSHAVMPINKSVYCNHKVKAVLLEDLISRRLAFEKRDQQDRNFSGGLIQSARLGFVQASGQMLKKIPLRLVGASG